mmetsp:Transcript_28780/g.87036  ORF Transcript_28780/g.87036 Transcript_28780/m.87036 type:complete len:205 (+) Transcript_28780:645-1259(+)
MSIHPGPCHFVSRSSLPPMGGTGAPGAVRTTVNSWPMGKDTCGTAPKEDWMRPSHFFRANVMQTETIFCMIQPRFSGWGSSPPTHRPCEVSGPRSMPCLNLPWIWNCTPKRSEPSVLAMAPGSLPVSWTSIMEPLKCAFSISTGGPLTGIDRDRYGPGSSPSLQGWKTKLQCLLRGLGLPPRAVIAAPGPRSGRGGGRGARPPA